METGNLFNIRLFENLKKQYLAGSLTSSKNIIQGAIEPPDEFLDYMPAQNSNEYNELYKTGAETIKSGEFAVAVVNGGMATRFGGIVKGVVEVFDNKSFLQLKIENALRVSNQFGVKIPVFIMNSIFTQNDTVKLFEENDYFGYDKDYIIFFNQYYFYRMDRYGNRPNTEDVQLLKYGSGHGDFFYAFREFVYPRFKESSLKYIFYSNVDNLGAYIEPAILGYHIIKNKGMTVELAEKNRGDKGGAPALVDGRKCIVEEFKFPRAFDQSRINVFNTASYIFSKEIFEREIDLPFYVVNKNADDTEVVQFERLAGDLTIFVDSNFLVIDRNARFFPVKTVEDLENSRRKLKELLKDKI